MEFEYPVFDCDLEIMKNFDHYKVIVKGIDIQENKLCLLDSEIDFLKDDNEDCLFCIVKFTGEGNPIITEISRLY